MFKRTVLAVGILALIFVVSGCGQKSLLENKIEKELEKSLGGNAQVNLGDNSMKIETEQGSIQVGGNASLPKDFPTDIYVIDGEIISAMKNVMGVGYQVAIKTNTSVKDVKELYEKKMKEAGWTIVSSMDLGTASVVSASKGKRQLTVSAGTEEGKEGTAVVLTDMEEQIQAPN